MSKLLHILLIVFALASVAVACSPVNSDDDSERYENGPNPFGGSR